MPPDLSEQPNPPEFVSSLPVSAMMFESSLAMGAVLLGDIFGHSPLETIPGTAGSASSPSAACIWGTLGAVPPILGLMIFTRLPLKFCRDLTNLVQDKIAPYFAQATLTQIALLSFAAGVGEELLFRGLIQDGIAMHLRFPTAGLIGLIIGSTFFGLCHAVTRAYFLFATVMGAYLGLIFLATDNLLAPIVTHAIYDFVAIWYVMSSNATRPKTAPPS